MKSENPLISIITVSYNAEASIEKTILSIISQTYSNYEYIIVDGGSTDGTLEIIKKYGSKINYWISEPDKGIYDAMNKGVSRVTGKWVNFMNSGDTFYSPETLFEIVNCFDDQYDVVYGAVNMVYETFNTVVNSSKKPSRNNPMPFNHQSVFVKRDLLNQHKFDISLRYAADYNFFNRIYQSAKYNMSSNIIASYAVDGVSSQNAIKVNRERIKCNPCMYNYYNHLLCYRNFIVKKAMCLIGLNNMINNARKIWLTK